MENNKHIIGNQILLLTLLKLVSDDEINKNLENATKELRSGLLAHMSENEYAMNLANKVTWCRKNQEVSNEHYTVNISLSGHTSTLNQFTSALVDYLYKDKNFINNFLAETEFNIDEYESYLDLIYCIINLIKRFENKNNESYYHPYDENLPKAFNAFNKKNIYRLECYEWNYKNLIDGIDISQKQLEYFEKLKKEYKEIINCQNDENH